MVGKFLGIARNGKRHPPHLLRSLPGFLNIFHYSSRLAYYYYLLGLIPSRSPHKYSRDLVLFPTCATLVLSSMAVLDDPQHVSIIDIRRDKIEDSLVKLILSGLKPDDGCEKSMPTLLLYDGSVTSSSFIAKKALSRGDHVTSRLTIP